MEIRQTTPTEAQETLAADPGATYLDVRTEAEFEQGHPPGSLNVPVMLFGASGGPAKLNDRFVEIVRSNIDTNRTLLIGCQSGMRSQRAAELLVGAAHQLSARDSAVSWVVVLVWPDGDVAPCAVHVLDDL